MKTIELKVEGMTCGGCVKSIQNALNEQTGINNAAADLDAATVTVSFDPAAIEEAAIKIAIEDAGFDVAA
ncbi:MAG: heavy-metal-associated domain-containing protein [Gammaproteobacteria bacterium]